MATIQQSIALADGVSPVLNKIGQVIDRTIGRFNRAAAAATGTENAVRNIGTGVDSLNAKLQTVGSGAFTNLNRLPILNNLKNNINTQVDGINAKLRSIGEGAFSGLKNIPVVNSAMNWVSSSIDRINLKFRGAGEGAFSGLKNIPVVNSAKW